MTKKLINPFSLDFETGDHVVLPKAKVKAKAKTNLYQRMHDAMQQVEQIRKSDEEVEAMMGKVPKTLKQKMLPNDFTARIKKGSYMISFILDYRVVYYSGKQKKAYEYNESREIAKQVKLSKVTDESNIINDIIDEWREVHYSVGSDFSITNVRQLNAIPVAKVDLKKTLMFGTSLSYNLLGDVKKINQHKNECVSDYIVYAVSGVTGLKHVTRQYLAGYGIGVGGVCAETIIAWAKAEKCISVHALDPMLHTFTKHIAKDAHVSLVFIVNNNHCYPILDKDMKRLTAITGKLDLNEFLFDVKYDDYHFIPTALIKSNNSELINGTIGGDKQIIILDSDNLTELSSWIIQQTGEIVYNVRFNQSNITAFEHPVTRKVYVGGSCHDLRKEVCNSLFSKLECEELLWKNQSFTAMAKMYFQSTCGALPASEYGPELLDIFKQYPLSPYIVQVIPSGRYNIDDVMSFDIKRDYTGILINNKTNFNVFSSFDQVEVFDPLDPLASGEYYIGKNIHMADDTIKLSRGWYPLVFVEHCLKNKYITEDDIQYVIKASFFLPHDTFSNFAQTIHQEYDDKGAKQLINCYIGDLNKQYSKVTKGAVTDSHLTALGTLALEQDKGNDAKIYQVNDLYFIRSDMKKPLVKGNVPIYRHIIASSYIKLDELYKKVHDENSVVVSYHTDSIKVINPREGIWDEIKDGDKQIPGDIRYEDSVNICGRDYSDICIFDPYYMKKLEWVKTEENDTNYEDIKKMVKSKSCFVTGMPGCGKTEMIIATATSGKYIVFGYTNGACEELRSRGIENVQTFDSFFLEKKSITGYLKQIAKYERIYVDEFSMTPSKFYSLLFQVKINCPQILITLMGDIDQCTPVDTLKWFKYDTSNLIKMLCDCNYIRLNYKFTRYDKSLYELLVYLREHKKLHPILKHKRLNNSLYTNMTKYSQKFETLANINQTCYNRFLAEFEPEECTIGNKKWCVNMPIIALCNNKMLEVYTSQKFNIKQFDKDDVIITKHDKDFTIPQSKFNSLFEYGFGATVYKYQGNTVREDFNIHNVNAMNFNEIYTALSRGITIDKIHFDYTNITFKVPQPQTDCKKRDLIIPDKKYLQGKVYLISDRKRSFIYIGSTVQSLEERLLQHKQKPVNKNMVELMKQNDITIELIRNGPCCSNEYLEGVENQYIQQYYNEGYNMANEKNYKPAIVKENVKIQIVQDKVLNKKKLNIHDHEKVNAFLIEWIADGKRTQKRFRYGKRQTKEQAYASACAFIEAYSG